MIANKKEQYSSYWNKEIALYKGEEILDQGTIREVAERRGVRKDTLYWGLMPTARIRRSRAKNQQKVISVVEI